MVEKPQRLHDELRAKPWEWPVVEHPDYVCDFPPGSPGAKAFAEALALYRELEEASKEL